MTSGVSTNNTDAFSARMQGKVYEMVVRPALLHGERTDRKQSWRWWMEMKGTLVDKIRV